MVIRSATPMTNSSPISVSQLQPNPSVFNNFNNPMNQSFSNFPPPIYTNIPTASIPEGVSDDKKNAFSTYSYDQKN